MATVTCSKSCSRHPLGTNRVQQYGPWQIRSSREVYRDPWIAVRRDEVIRPDGADGTHVLVWMKPGVSVLALDDDGSVYLADEFHYAITTVRQMSCVFVANAVGILSCVSK